MTEVAILTPDPADASYSSLWSGVLDRLRIALASAGVTATPTPWTAHVEDCDELKHFALVLPLLVWGYHHDHERWLQACRTWDTAALPLANPAAVLAWNSDKRYLEQLGQRGVAIPPTTWTDRVTQRELDEAFAATGAEQLIVKPAVSGGARPAWLPGLPCQHNQPWGQGAFGHELGLPRLPWCRSRLGRSTLSGEMVRAAGKRTARAGHGTHEGSCRPRPGLCRLPHRSAGSGRFAAARHES